MSVTITKVGEGVFKVQRDNVYMDGQFNVTSINDNVNFYTKESNEFLRNILYSDISIVDDTQGGSVYNPTKCRRFNVKT
jgi:thermostable 8-oxoguanine DNA glycosylase